MDLANLSQRELRVLKSSLAPMLVFHPELGGLYKLVEVINTKLASIPDYQKGLALLNLAVQHSSDNGYAEPSDYYFVVKPELIGGKPHVELILCYKYEWWLNGQAYLTNAKQGDMCRNFGDFLPDRIWDPYMEKGEFTCSAQELRQALLQAGLEEWPPLVQFYDEACAASADTPALKVRQKVLLVP